MHLQRRDLNYLIVNQRFFHNVDFFVYDCDPFPPHALLLTLLRRFFINIFVGLYSFIIRLVINILLGMLWISRLDKNMMTRGYEHIDPGYRTYVGFLMLDYHYCNPVMVTFATMLSASNTQRRHNRKLFLKEVGQLASRCPLASILSCTRETTSLPACSFYFSLRSLALNPTFIPL